MAITAKNNPPNHVIFDITDDKYSVVGFPALIPGINPPFFLMLLDISAGLNVANVQKNENPTINNKYTIAYNSELVGEFTPNWFNAFYGIEEWYK